MMIRQPPTLDELRREYEREQEGRSRFHRSICPVCGALVTNQAMGRAAHIRMHKREKTASVQHHAFPEAGHRHSVLLSQEVMVFA